MKRILLATSAALFSISAFAVDFTGHWIGTGTMTQASPFLGNKTLPCSKVEIVLEHLTDKLTIQHYVATCGGIDPDWGPHVMVIRDGKIFEDDEETGTLVGDTLKTLQASGGVQYAFNLRLKTPPPGQPPVLETYYGVRNMTGTIVVEGNLSAK